MIRGIYISGTSLLTNSRKIDAISNNIANIETTGFKRDDVTAESFNDVLIAKFNGSQMPSEDAPGSIEFEKSGDDYAASTEAGFFRVQTDTGVSHNRVVKFTVDDEGYLSTYYLNSDRSKNWNLGDRLIGASGSFIQVGTGDYEIAQDGRVLVQGEVVDNLVTAADKNVIGTMNAGVKMTRVFTDFTQGQIVRTGNQLDFAIEGEGFFVIETPFGEAYTRNGHFKIDGEGRLVTAEGYRVQGFDGDIDLSGSEVATNDFGEILVDNVVVDKFKMVDVSNTGDLLKVGNGLYRLKDDPSGEVRDFEGNIYQFSQEQSNADAITEMINMMTLQRNYEASQRVILTHDNLLDKAVNSVGRVG